MNMNLNLKAAALCVCVSAPASAFVFTPGSVGASMPHSQFIGVPAVPMMRTFNPVLPMALPSAPQAPANFMLPMAAPSAPQAPVNFMLPMATPSAPAPAFSLQTLKFALPIQ